MPRVSLFSTTVAPGMTPPCESLTVPLMLPVVICALAGDAAARIATIARASIPHFLNCMLPPPVTCTCSDARKMDRPGAALRCPVAVSRNGAGRPLVTVGLPVACAQPSSRGGTASRRALRAQPPGSAVNACVRGRSRSAKPSATCMQSLALKRFHMRYSGPTSPVSVRKAALGLPALSVPRFDWQHAVSDGNTTAPRLGLANRISSKKFAGNSRNGGRYVDPHIAPRQAPRRPSKTVKRRLNSSSGWSSGSGGTSRDRGSRGSRVAPSPAAGLLATFCQHLLAAGGAPPPPARVGPTPTRASARFARAGG